MDVTTANAGPRLPPSSATGGKRSKGQTAMLALLLSAALAPAETALKPAAGVKPHIVMHLADDFGWANAVSPALACSRSAWRRSA